ncbi:DUF3558 domain-containing protein [Nocardia sp. NPDC057353]|uniref:DUF3558 domain-containing protein n=1 Tax=Nocardia sp. NPDC057353 TaxID=3346104 RepID=UPI0036282CFF
MRGRWALFFALALVPVTAGCESSTEGSATPSSIAPEALFNPCVVPDGVVVAAGADPASKNDNPFGTPRTGWVGCRWLADRYALRIFATTKTIDEFRANDYFKDFREADLAGRQAVTFAEGRETPPGNCSVAYPTSQGTIQFLVSKDVTLAELPDPCEIVLRAARSADQSIPR